jgi:hypothetical protein
VDAVGHSPSDMQVVTVPQQAPKSRVHANCRIRLFFEHYQVITLRHTKLACGYLRILAHKLRKLLNLSANKSGIITVVGALPLDEAQ